MFEIPENVIHEVVDGETMLVRLDTGNYYNMNATGGQIWALIERGASKNQIVSSFAERYTMDSGDLEEPIDTFIKYLIVEELIIPKPSSDNGSVKPFGLVLDVAGSFEPPQLYKYSDMQELLILDPIHEVSDAGWPNPKPENE